MRSTLIRILQSNRANKIYNTHTRRRIMEISSGQLWRATCCLICHLKLENQEGQRSISSRVQTFKHLGSQWYNSQESLGSQEPGVSGFNSHIKWGFAPPLAFGCPGPRRLLFTLAVHSNLLQSVHWIKCYSLWETFSFSSLSSVIRWTGP